MTEARVKLLALTAAFAALPLLRETRDSIVEAHSCLVEVGGEVRVVEGTLDEDVAPVVALYDEAIKACAAALAAAEVDEAEDLLRT